MLPRQVVYLVEEYKFEAALVFSLCIIVSAMPVVSLAIETPRNRQLNSATLYYDEEIHKKQPPSATPASPEPGTAQTAVMLPDATQPEPVQTTMWPIPGRVTTDFGVPHRPWQDTHTGLDISSGQRSGATNIVAFKDGIVTSVVRNNGGLGRHVIVDHGEGLSSVYAHLYTIAVTEGQLIKMGDTVGAEGNTGMSTGPHLHFEVRLNGVPVEPRAYIAGTP